VITTDVLVVGAGPAGCAAAYDLAASGRDVLLVDRRHFPRVKPCAGALTPKTLRALRFPVTPVIKQVVATFVTRRNDGPPTEFQGRHPVAVMTVRAELDQYVLERTRAAGARFSTIGAIREIRYEPDHVLVRTSTGQFRSRYLVGADGANSVVRVMTREFPDIGWGFGIEGHVSGSAATPRFEIDFGVVPFGYGWVFPKGSHFNVGLFTSEQTVALHPDRLRDYARSLLGACDVTHIVGQRVGLGGWRYRPRNRRVFLVGDAAGLTEPLLGEGIYYAVKSGQAAAAAIAAELEGAASARVHFRQRIRVLSRDILSASRLASRFHADPGLGHRILTTPVVTYCAVKGCAAGMTIRDVTRRFYTLPFRRVRPLPGLPVSTP
jgi:geranylgeranyl reductase family protein